MEQFFEVGSEILDPLTTGSENAEFDSLNYHD